MKRRFITGLIFAGFSAILFAAEPATVILPDGFVIQGNYARETETMSDGSGKPIQVAKTDGFDVIQDGPKYVIFSTHAGRGGKIEKELTRNRGTEYKTKLKTNLKKAVLPWTKINKTTEFNSDWIRVLEMTTIDNTSQTVRQQIIKLDAYSYVVDSPTDALSQSFHTFEETPETIRKWLSMHPELREASGKPDPEKRLKIATFLKDVAAFDGTRRQILWLLAARQELDKLKKDAPENWDKKVTEAFDQLKDEIEKAETRIIVDELESAVKTGRYDMAKKFLAGFQPKLSDAKDTTRLVTVKAAIESVQPQYERTLALLRTVIERESGMLTIQTTAAITGVAPAIFAPRPKLTPTMQTLIEAGSMVMAELHPDTTSRLELFHDLAKQSEARRSLGQEPSEKSDALLAYAITGWLKGKNGADKSLDGAIRCWNTRKLATDYLGETTANRRKIVLDNYTKANPQPLNADELTQIITLLPPPLAMDLANPTWKALPAAECDGVNGIVRINTGPRPDVARGVDYVLRLPPEYHHGRAYPVVLILPSRNLSATQIVARMAEQAERNGYILVAAEWTNQFGNGLYDFHGKQHPIPLEALRDVFRKFQADADKVFLFGFAEGANFALDLAMAHPDIFAGLAGFGTNPPPSIFLEYWHNLQKLPAYFVSGEFANAFPNLSTVFKKWMPRGFPAMMTLYRGRGIEWFTAEVPRLFDWMNRKTRVRGSGSLRINKFSVEPWQVLRETDNRYYWIGVGEGGVRSTNPLAGGIPNQLAPPPQFAADIGRAGIINITMASGIRKFVIWMERDLVDWTKPIRININGSPPVGYKPAILKPDLQLMLEEIYRTGDRKMLFLGKIEIDAPG
jgi:pimeloyl-ACP methyl ester carboxylesterase